MIGKVAVVIEGAREAGKIISKALIEKGATVHILALDAEEAIQVIEDEMFVEAGNDERIYRACATPCLTSNITAVNNCVKIAQNIHGRVDYVIEIKEMAH